MRLARKIVVLGVVAVVGVVVLPIFNVGAVVNENIEGSGQEFELAVSPGYVEAELVPGTTSSETFRVRNAGAMETDIRIGVRALEFSSETTVLGTPRNEIVDWTTITLQSGCEASEIDPNTGDVTVRMRVKEECFVDATIRTPLSAPFGEQYMSVFFQEYKEDGGGGMQMIRSIGANVYGTNKMGDGSSDTCGKISGQTIPFYMMGGALETTATIENCGQLNFHSTMKIEVRDLFGGLVYEDAQPNDKIIPAESRREVRDAWTEAGIGIYWVRQTIEALGETYVVEGLTFIVPVWLVVVILLAIVVIVFTIIHDRKKKQSRGLGRWR